MIMVHDKNTRVIITATVIATAVLISPSFAFVGQHSIVGRVSPSFSKAHRQRELLSPFSSPTKESSSSLKVAQAFVDNFTDSSIDDVTQDNDSNNDDSPSLEEETNSDKKENIRPLHQNWWPVSTTAALQSDRPNAIQVLGKRLVLYASKTSKKEDDEIVAKEWKCLEDRCSHRFAPLSEGRVIPDADNENQNRLQCVYHGWQFDGCGSCKCIPQLEESTIPKKSTAVPSYPVKEDVGLIWVWMDPSSDAESSSSDVKPSDVKLPVSPLLRKVHDAFGDLTWFMRDLPYGMELLGENLLDLGHLPFSHHTVGSLTRDLGGPLPFKMLTKQEKQKEAAQELELPGANDTLTFEDLVIPNYQVDLPNASQYDPTFLGLLKNNMPIDDDATCTVAFYPPTHVRYRRRPKPSTDPNGATHVELFLCPIEGGKSRVFLGFQTSTMFLPPPPKTDEDGAKKKKNIFSIIKAWTTKKVVTKMVNSPRGHLIAHAIFDGDGIFLHKQGDRMKKFNKTYKNYATPSSADVLVNAYRRYLDNAAMASEQIGDELACKAVSYPAPDAATYTDTAGRDVLLDRYESHTVHCQLCRDALNKCEQRQKVLNILGNVLWGAVGSCGLVAINLMLASFFIKSFEAPSKTMTRMLARMLGVSSVFSLIGTRLVSIWKKKTEKEIDQFKFQDYVHADIE